MYSKTKFKGTHTHTHTGFLVWSPILRNNLVWIRNSLRSNNNFFIQGIFEVEDGAFIEDEQHMKLFARGAERFLLGNILVVLGSNATIFREGLYACKCQRQNSAAWCLRCTSSLTRSDYYVIPLLLRTCCWGYHCCRWTRKDMAIVE